MSVEKMTMMNIVGDINLSDDVLKNLLKTGKVDLVSAVTQIERSDFLFDVSDENLDKLINLNYARSFKRDQEIQNMFEKAEELKNIMNVEIEIDPNIELLSEDKLQEELETIIKEVEEPSILLEALRSELKHLEKFHVNSFSRMEDYPIKLEDLRNMEYFDFKMGILSRENYFKLKKNYENILAILQHSGSTLKGEVYFVLYPKKLEVKITRILRSLNFREINLSDEYSGTPKEVKEDIENQKEKLNLEIKVQEEAIEDYKSKNTDRIKSILGQVSLISKVEEAKRRIAVTNKYFYLSGWVADSDKEEIKSVLPDHKDLLVLFKDEVLMSPPTKLKNNWLFKPFEWMVNMYGTPAYNEIDPTPFVSLSYMLLFGMMFGDVGQGLVFVIAGIYLAKKTQLGGILARIGASSMLFGFMYGSVFGLETIIPAVWMRPFENINDILIITVYIGIGLLMISYVFGLINAYRRKDIEGGIFGAGGIAGVLLYVTLLLFAGGIILGIDLIPSGIAKALIVITIASILFSVPLTRLVQKKKPLHEGAVGGYYVEAVFEIIETLLSMLSGTISFIRVGAFALVHVGLFMAFATMGQMMNSAGGNIFMIVLGNIFIIVLEGLIVFIQGLRLQYYELFSRYYTGGGRLFKAIGLEK